MKSWIRSSTGNLKEKDSYPEVSLTLEGPLSTLFLPLLQQGFRIEAEIGCSVTFLLCDRLGVSPDYLEDRIKTILLDGKPVDEADSAIIRDGSTLALSAAMPGLVGAAMRRGGILSPFRSTIAYQCQNEPAVSGQGMVVIKLFNLLMKELGPLFLEQGIWVQRGVLKDTLKTKGHKLDRICRSAKLDGEEVAVDRLHQMTWSQDKDLMLLTVALEWNEGSGCNIGVGPAACKDCGSV